MTQVGPILLIYRQLIADLRTVDVEFELDSNKRPWILRHHTALVMAIGQLSRRPMALESLRRRTFTMLLVVESIGKKSGFALWFLLKAIAMNKFPSPNATREEVAAWLKEHGAAPRPSCIQSEDPPHEAPPVENGPSLMCNACGKVRVSMLKPFCNGCMRVMEAAGVQCEGMRAAPILEDKLVEIEEW